MARKRLQAVLPANKRLEKAIGTLLAAGVPLCTLNYDPLLERVTGLPAVDFTEKVKVAEWMRREGRSILHLHGSWDAPPTCILGIRDYDTTLGNDFRDLIQRNRTFKLLLFIGCGGAFADPTFSPDQMAETNRQDRRPRTLRTRDRWRVATRNADPGWQGFVEPLAYGASHGELAGFLLKHFPAPASTAAKKQIPGKVASSTRGQSRLLQDYRAFLLKDCGQMTIEGVRADMDTAQRRFDLERLFVPLSALPTPPEIPKSDPLREQKLHEWQDKNKEPIPFGEVFSPHKQIALLALPGGGKTILLKRLAVAYAEPSRRSASSDALPDVNLTPVLIRCREWRDHIHRPIPTIFKNLPDITGQGTLVGLNEALVPLFKKGLILLLVDGLDEIHDDGMRTTFVEHLEAFLADNPLTPLVVTSREAGFDLVAPSLARFCKRWRVAPLNRTSLAHSAIIGIDS